MSLAFTPELLVCLCALGDDQEGRWREQTCQVTLRVTLGRQAEGHGWGGGGSRG